MNRTIAILVTAFALTTWSVAQSEQSQSSDENKSNSSQGFVSGPTVDAKDHSASIRWETQDKAATIVKYGTDKNNLDKQSRHDGGSRHHNVTLAELKPSTKYYYEIRKMDGSVRGAGEFTTQAQSSSTGDSQGSGNANQGNADADDNVVITEGPSVQPGADGTAKIVWKTDNIGATDVKYGTDPNNLQQRAYKSGGAKDHQADLKNLQAGQTYYFQILRRNGSVRSTGQFQYQPTNSAAASTPGPTATQQQSSLQFTLNPVLDTVGDRAALIKWQTNSLGSTTVRYGTDPNNMNQTATGSWGTDHSATLSNLNPSTRYYFVTESSPSPGTGNDLKSGLAFFTTTAPGAQAKKNAPINQ